MNHRLLTLVAVPLLSLQVISIARGAADGSREGELKPFLGEAKFEKHVLFDGQRFPNVLVAADGSVLATWGSQQVRVRRSEDGGDRWGPEIAIGEGIHGGGAIVDPLNDELWVFVHPEHPPRDGETAPRTAYRSTDHGKTWAAAEADFEKDTHGYIPSLHMSEHGVTLVHGEHQGRLVRPARVYRRSPERYATTIYSDDRGASWQAGEPPPMRGTGEAALVELSDGSLLYTARRSYFPEDEAFRSERLFFRSRDGGESWSDPSYLSTIPDGPRYRGEQRRGANYNGHFGMLSGLTRLPIRDRDVLIYSNADHDGHERIRLTLWASFDGGKTWPIKRLVHQGPSAYSSLTAGRPDTDSQGWIYLQYEYGEGDQQYVGCQLARFNLSWLLQGESTGDGSVPTWVTALAE